MMDGFDVIFHEKLKKELSALIVDLEHHISGGSAQNFEQYKHVCGQIWAFREVLTLAQRIRDVMLERDKQPER